MKLWIPYPIKLWRWLQVEYRTYKTSPGKNRSFNEGARPKYQTIEEGLKQIVDVAIKKEENISMHRLLLEARAICEQNETDDEVAQAFKHLKPTAQRSWLRRFLFFFHLYF